MSEWISVKPDYSARKKGFPIMPIEERLKASTKLNERTGCWEWQGSKRGGYGRMIVGSRTDGTRRSESAHRVSYTIYHGEIPEGMEVCHKCDNPCCVNPDHLFAGTRKENMEDRESKGRNITFTGEEQPRAKLTKKTVKAARQERAQYGTPYSELAKKYGVSKKTMQNAIKGVTWKCVKYMPEPPVAVAKNAMTTATVAKKERVRCADCRHLMFSDCYGECGEGHRGVVRPDDFCSYGERREKNENQ